MTPESIPPEQLANVTGGSPDSIDCTNNPGHWMCQRGVGHMGLLVSGPHDRHPGGPVSQALEGK